MRILLLGEFSGLHKNLKEGLVELGHDVTIASQGDGWKNIKSDIWLGTNKRGVFGKAIKLFKLFNFMPKFKNFDIVQVLTPVPFPKNLGINTFIMNYIFKHNKKVFLVAAGATTEITPIADFCENNYKYPQLYLEIKKTNPTMWSQTKFGRYNNAKFLNSINGVIPIMYEYAQGFRDIEYNKLCPTIPIPMNIDKIQYEDNIVKEKVVFFHGLNREGVKGTPLIRKALQNLENKYPNEVEIIIDGKMPLEKYLQVLRKTNVVIDQVYSVSNGVNAIYSLAMGKVVVGGGEPESLREFGIDVSPLVRIQPSVESIESQLEMLVKNKDKILQMGKESRRYAENIHDYKKIAQKYIDCWLNAGHGEFAHIKKSIGKLS